MYNFYTVLMVIAKLTCRFGVFEKNTRLHCIKLTVNVLTVHRKPVITRPYTAEREIYARDGLTANLLRELG
jgi:hypothetical protein